MAIPMMWLRRWFICLISMTSLVASTANASPAESAGSQSVAQGSADARIDALLKEWDTPSTPGASVAVIDHGKLVFARGYGIANLEYGVPIAPETIFHAASVSKQITAMAVVLLESEGKLSIDDDIHKYLPELPEYGYKITLRNLLNHTSGVRDQWQTLALAGWSLQDVITQDQILRLLFRQKQLNFPPRARMLYSNSGYTLLAEIVTRVSGKPVPQFCAERIFSPLGMTHTHFHQDLTQVVPDRAYSYRKDATDYSFEPLNYANVGATSLFTTATDLAKWLDNLRDPKVGGAAGVAEMQEPGTLSDGTKTTYGLGLELGTYRGLATVSHGGSDAGYRSEVLWFPEQQLGIAVLSNLANFSTGRIAYAVASVYLGDKRVSPQHTAPPARPPFIAANPRNLKQYVGVYPLPKNDQIFTTVVDDGKLWAAGEYRPPLELHLVGPAHFYCTELHADIEFSTRPDGHMSVKLTQPSGVAEGERIRASQGAPASDLLPYTGVYWSDELEAQYTVFMRGGIVFLRHLRHGEFALTPTVKDEFTSNLWFAPRIRFLRNSGGSITSMTLGGGRVTGVIFRRKTGGSIREALPATVHLSSAALAAIVGRYDYKGPILTITQNGDRAFAQLGAQPKYEIFAKSDTEFYWNVVNAEVMFIKNAQGNVVGAAHSQSGRIIDAPRFPEVADILLDEASVDSMLGDYDAGPAIQMTISKDAGKLFSRLTGQPRFELGALSDNELYLKQWDAQLTVVRGKEGQVMAMISHQNGANHEWPKVQTPKPMD